METETHIATAYMLISVITVVLAVLHWTVNFKCRNIIAAFPPSNQSHAKHGGKAMRTMIIVIMYFYQTVYALFIRGYGNLLLLFAVGYLGWPKGRASILTSLFYFPGILTKLLNICIVRYVKIEILIPVYTTLCAIGFILLTLLIDISDSVIWVGTVYISLVESATIGLVMSWTDKYLGLVGWAAVTAPLGRMTGEVIAPIVITPLMVNVSYKYFLYVTTSAVIVALISIFPMQYLGLKYIGRNARTM
jgi:hypothetical protein